MNFDALTSAVQGAAVPGGVTFESSLLPPLTLLRPDPGGGGNDGPPSDPPLWVRLVRPKFTAQTLAGAVVVAPGGDPPDFPFLGIALAGAALFVVALAVYGGLRMVRP